jgi:fatty acid kinase fatty acid binding subunit
MPAVAIVTDTTQYLPAEVIQRHGLHLVSLYVNWDGRTDRESDLPDYDAFYDHMRSAATLPSTSQPSVGDFLAVFEPLLEAGNDVLSIHLSGGISGTVHAAEQARDALLEQGIAPERIVVLDSETGCAGHGLMAIAAANAVRGGADLAGATDAARSLRETMRILFAVDTLEYLRRGGRIGGAQAWIGSALKIKPILTFGTEISPVGKVRTKGRALQRMEAYLEELGARGATDWIVQHAQSPADAEHLTERGTAILGKPPLFCTEVGPVLGAHLGSGMLVGGIGVAPAAG